MAVSGHFGPVQVRCCSQFYSSAKKSESIVDWKKCVVKYGLENEEMILTLAGQSQGLSRMCT